MLQETLLFTLVINGELFYGAAERIQIEEGLDWVLIQSMSQNFYISKIAYARTTAFIVAGVIGFFILLISLYIMRETLGPLRAMSAIFRAAAHMDTASIVRLPKSLLKEVSDMQGNIDIMVQQLREYKKYIPESVLYASISNEPESNLSLSFRAETKKYIKVQLFYMERDGHTLKTKNTAQKLLSVTTNEFLFSYSEGEVDVLHRFSNTCRKLAKIVLGQEVMLQFKREEDVWSVFTTDMDLILAISTHPQLLEVRISKHGTRNPMALVRSFTNVFSFLFSFVFLNTLYGEERYVLAMGLVIALALQAITNVLFGQLFLRHATDRNPHFAAWTEKRVTETRMVMFLAMYNVVNLEVLACKMSIAHVYSFHAPLLAADLRELERLSVLGVVLGPFVSILINIVHLVSNSSHNTADPRISLTCLICSFVSLGFTLMRLVVLTSFDMEKTKNNKEEEYEEEEMVVTRVAASALSVRHVSLLHIILADTSELEEMCTSFYDVSFRMARAHSGVVTYFHGGELTILFNGITDVALHGAVAVRCAFSILERMACHCGVVSDTMRVGNLGTITRRAFQHISPAYVLCRGMAELAQRFKIHVLVTVDVADATIDADQICGTMTHVMSKPLWVVHRVGDVGSGGTVIQLCALTTNSGEECAMIPPGITLGNLFV